MKPAPLRTPRLVLNTPAPADAAAMTAYCQDSDIARFVPIPVPYTLDHAIVFIDRVVPNGWEQDAEYNFAIRPRRTQGQGGTDREEGIVADGTSSPQGGGCGGPGFMGMIGARRVDGDASTFDLGLWLGAPYRRVGYATEACRSVIDWLVREVGAERVTWQALVGNAASVATAAALGFRSLGIGASEAEFRDRTHPLVHRAVLARADVTR